MDTKKDPFSDTSDVIIPVQFDPVIRREDKRFEWDFYGKEGTKMGAPLMTTRDCRLQFFDKYIEFEATVQTDFIFGMGERVDTFHLKNDNTRCGAEITLTSLEMIVNEGRLEVIHSS